MKNKYKLILFFLLFTIIVLIFVSTNKEFFYYKTKNLYHKLPGYLKSLILLTSNKKKFQNIDNDYNVRFLPETQYLNFNFSKKKIRFEDANKNTLDNYFYKNILNLKYYPLYTFYLDFYEDQIYITTKKGDFYKTTISKALSKKSKLNSIKVKSNIKFNRILDSLIFENKLYISVVEKKKNCNQLSIYYSDLSNLNNNFDFKLFKNFQECGDHWVTAGRMQPLQFKEKKGIIVSTSTGPKSKDTPGDQPQDDFSIFGKIIFIDLDKKNHFIFTKGHREIQGLYVKENIILSTEHGPRGGDEVNKLIFNSNYGWPLASYGEAYYDKEKKYLKSHVENGFKEPLISFVPSIGISELIIVPHDFSPSWGNSVFVTSLNGKSIYRLQFESKEYKNILLTEKIYIGQRIRDIKYIPNKNVFFLALENFGEIGILEKVN